MEVTLQLPDDIFKDLEYIPVELLPSVLLNVIRKGMALQEEEERRSLGGEDMGKIISMLQKIVQSNETVESVEPVVEVKKPVFDEVKVVPFVRSGVVADNNEEEDIEDFLDLMK